MSYLDGDFCEDWDEDAAEEEFLLTLPPVVQAAARGDIETLKALLDDGASPDEAAEDGWFALAAACTRNRVDVVERLLRLGADVEKCDHNGATALMYASSSTAEVVRLLLDAGANVHAVDDEGSGALDQAASCGNVPAVELLIAAGAPVNASDENGWTPIFGAADAGEVAVVELLLKHGADPDVADHSGDTARMIAVEHGYEAIGNLLTPRDEELRFRVFLDWLDHRENVSVADLQHILPTVFAEADVNVQMSMFMRLIVRTVDDGLPLLAAVESQAPFVAEEIALRRLHSPDADLIPVAELLALAEMASKKVQVKIVAENPPRAVAEYLATNGVTRAIRNRASQAGNRMRYPGMP